MQHVITLKNNGLVRVTGVQVADSLPSGTLLVSAPGLCAGSTTVTCSLGTLTPTALAWVALLVMTSTVVPARGVITDTATASPGSNTGRAWPPTAWCLWPHGSWVYVDGGELNLGVVRNSLLNSMNNCQIFSELFRTAIRVSGESLTIDCDVPGWQHVGGEDDRPVLDG